MRFVRSVLALIILFSTLPFFPLRAQTTGELWLTWRATTYVPPKYGGRALPIPDTKIIAALDFLQGGRPVSLTDQNIYWYVNDTLLRSGKGLTRITVAVPNAIGGGTFSVRASLPDYEGGIAKTVDVPVTNPLAVVTSNSPGNVIHTSPFLVSASPYFFDIASPDELDVSWKVNGVSPSRYSDPFALNVSLQDGTPTNTSITLDLRFTNPSKILEFATRRVNLLYKP